MAGVVSTAVQVGSSKPGGTSAAEGLPNSRVMQKMVELPQHPMAGVGGHLGPTVGRVGAAKGLTSISSGSADDNKVCFLIYLHYLFIYFLENENMIIIYRLNDHCSYEPCGYFSLLWIFRGYFSLFLSLFPAEEAARRTSWTSLIC